MKFIPIIYIRGFAGTQGEVEATVDDPFYGFNLGSTHVRLGPQGDPQFFGFESPLVRLITDWGYRDVYDRGQQDPSESLGTADRLRTLWIYRYYDPTSKTFKSSPNQRLTIEEAAAGLRELILRVKRITGAPKVHLVAHSMGGLVARCFIQKTCPEHREPAERHVDKLFTYGTPHGGIHFAVGGGVLEWVRDQVGWNNADDFGRERMHRYLTANAPGRGKVPRQFDPQDLQGRFDSDRVFCVVGTNAQDYDVAMGMSRRTVGPQSDGLVQTAQAYVRGASRAYVHRAHSGRYGMVNSEEGFQNLQRFLFGSVRVGLHLNELALPKEKNVTYQADVAVSIRGLPILMQEQTVKHYCPLTLGAGQVKSEPLFTSFLLPSHSATNDNTARFAIALAIHRVRAERGWFSFTHHVESLPLWSDHLVVDVQPDADGAGFSGRYGWLSERTDPEQPLELTEARGHPGAYTACAYFPGHGRQVAGPRAHIGFETSFWD